MQTGIHLPLSLGGKLISDTSLVVNDWVRGAKERFVKCFM